MTELVQLNVRIPQNLKTAMQEYIKLGCYKDVSELTREALREKLKRDAPQLWTF
jgi:Arc/MetJ-type ribon-helix-helix transcriptional regulator